MQSRHTLARWIGTGIVSLAMVPLCSAQPAVPPAPNNQAPQPPNQVAQPPQGGVPAAPRIGGGLLGGLQGAGKEVVGGAARVPVPQAPKQGVQQPAAPMVPAILPALANGPRIQGKGWGFGAIAKGKGKDKAKGKGAQNGKGQVAKGGKGGQGHAGGRIGNQLPLPGNGMPLVGFPGRMIPGGIVPQIPNLQPPMQPKGKGKQ